MRKSLPTTLAAAAVAACLTAGTAAPANAAPVFAAAKTSTTIGVRTVDYGPYRSNIMDVYTPAKAVGKKGQKLPVVVLIHGGSWIKGTKDSLAPQARQFANRGYVAISMNYRLGAQWPRQRTDAIRLVKFLQSHQHSLNVDATRIVLIGSSAGAHIAASAAMYKKGKELVRGVVSLSGPLDPRRTANELVTSLSLIVTNTLMGCLPLVCPSRYNSANAINWINRHDPPSLVFTSRNEWLDPGHSVAFVNRAREVGLDSRLVWMSGSQHATEYWDRAWPTIIKWVGAKTKKL